MVKNSAFNLNGDLQFRINYVLALGKLLNVLVEPI